MAKGLCITRKAGESVYIGDDIVITVEATDSNTVSLRIKAPADVPIHRDAERVMRNVLPMAAKIKKGR